MTESECALLARRWAVLSVVSNSFLVVLKVVAGVVGGSVAVLAEAAHSSIDLLAATIAFFSVRAASKAPDSEHPYGHGKIENFSALIEAVLIVVAAIWIIVESVEKIVHPKAYTAAWLLLVTMGISVVTNYLVSAKLMSVARVTVSPALEADAWHLRTDVWASLAIFAGIGVVHLFELAWLDPLLAIVVAVAMLAAGLKLSKQSVNVLLDSSVPPEELERIKGVIARFQDEFQEIHRIRARRAGRQLHVDFHLLMSRDTPLEKVHSLADKIEEALKQEFPNIDVTIHPEPFPDASLMFKESESRKTPFVERSQEEKK